MNIVAFDLGASGGKVYLARIADTAVLEQIHSFENTASLINGGLYWDVIRIYQELNIGLARAVARTGDDIDCFGMDAFSNDFCLLDKNGEMLCPVRCYRDKRTQRYEQKIYATMPKERLYALTGNQTALFNTLMQLAAMREAGQGHLLEHCAKLLFLPDLFTQFLTGRAFSEYTLASVSQMYSYEKQGWCKEIIEAFALPKHMLCEIVQPGTVVGRTTAEYNAQLNTKGFRVAAVCAHDTASAFVGSGVSDGAIISSGTWALVGAYAASPVIDAQTYQYNIANEGGYPGKHRLIRNVMGTWLIQELRKDYARNGQQYSFEELEAMALCAPAFQYYIDVDDAAFFQPGDMLQKIHNFCMERHGCAPQSVGEAVRCVYESLAFKYRWAIEKLEQVVKRPLPSITIVGGGVKAAGMCQFTANACNRPVTAGSPFSTALGNIGMQMVAIGAAPTIEEAVALLGCTYTAFVYQPKDTDNWEKEYLRFVEILRL